MCLSHPSKCGGAAVDPSSVPAWPVWSLVESVLNGVGVPLMRVGHRRFSFSTTTYICGILLNNWKDFRQPLSAVSLTERIRAGVLVVML